MFIFLSVRLSAHLLSAHPPVWVCCGGSVLAVWIQTRERGGCFTLHVLPSSFHTSAGPLRFLSLYTTFSLFFCFSFKLSLCFSLHSLSSSSSLHLLPFVLPSPPPSVSYRSWQLPLTITQVGRHDNALMWSNINDLASFPRAHNLFIYWNDSKAARACIYAAALW